mmetsp:Transcript_50205/g.98868  ORF Transcript_50205/g.98868 Transcript_50205/m.98868 type:complete len:80 (-) Transcript_50205:1810-2049(-)
MQLAGVRRPEKKEGLQATPGGEERRGNGPGARAVPVRWKEVEKPSISSHPLARISVSLSVPHMSYPIALAAFFLVRLKQ